MKKEFSSENHFAKSARLYLSQLENSFSDDNLREISSLAKKLRQAWTEQRSVYICGNGGSAANAIHLANDFHYGIGACGEGSKLTGLRVEALPANAGVITCLANDTGYENIFAHQLEVKGNKDDMLIVLSGSGNSENIIRALKISKKLGMESYAILAFNGGRAIELADHSIHFEINDMQIAEDTQLIVGHLCMQWLTNNKPHEVPKLVGNQTLR